MKKIVIFGLAFATAAVLAYGAKREKALQNLILGSENGLYKNVACMKVLAERNCTCAEVISTFCAGLIHA